MNFARWVFRISGIFGILVLMPMFFREEEFNRTMPPAITHPEFFYGFAGLGLVFQIVFLIISTDPARYRPLMIVAILEKLAFSIPVIVLHLHGRVPHLQMVHAAMMDIAFALLFLVTYLKTPSRPLQA